MKVAIHQPEHFPYLGFFQKMEACDIFVLLDDVQFTKNNFQNRNKYLGKDGKEHWFTVPVGKHANKYLIKDIPAPKGNWRNKIVNQLKQEFNEDFTYIYEPDMLVDMNYETIIWCRYKLKITTPVELSSTLDVAGKSSEKLYHLCKYLGADTYLSGIGGKEYLDENVFKDIKVEYFEPDVPNYYSTLYNIKKGD